MAIFLFVKWVVFLVWGLDWVQLVSKNIETSKKI